MEGSASKNGNIPIPTTFEDESTTGASTLVVTLLQALR
jgi:hypothetical protein